MGYSACQGDLLARLSKPSSVGLSKYQTQNLESILLKEICDKIFLHVLDKKSESGDVKEEPFSEKSQEDNRKMRSHGSDSEASESEKDTGTEDDESETKYFRDAESDDAFGENESMSDLDSWDDQIVKQEDESANNQSGQEISNQ
jgi:hypothetical protein